MISEKKLLNIFDEGTQSTVHLSKIQNLSGRKNSSKKWKLSQKDTMDEKLSKDVIYRLDFQ